MHCSSCGKGEAVLFIHGMPTSGRLWDGVVRDLAGHFLCFTVDLPGMGGTPFLSYGPSYFEKVAEQIEEVRVRNHIQRWHIVGHDGGCAVAIHYAHLFPKRVGRMALLSPAIFSDLRPFFLLEILRKPILGEISAPLMHVLFWHIAMHRAIPARRNQSQRARFFANFSGVTGPWKLMRLVRWGRPEVMLKDTPSILRKLTCPTLVLHGKRDVLPESFARRTADLIENARLVMLDSGHFIPLEQANQVARRLLAYFNSRGAKQADENSPHEPRMRAARVGRIRRQVDLVPASAAQ